VGRITACVRRVGRGAHGGGGSGRGCGGTGGGPGAVLPGRLGALHPASPSALAKGADHVSQATDGTVIGESGVSPGVSRGGQPFWAAESVGVYGAAGAVSSVGDGGIVGGGRCGGGGGGGGGRA